MTMTTTTHISTDMCRAIYDRYEHPYTSNHRCQHPMYTSNHRYQHLILHESVVVVAESVVVIVGVESPAAVLARALRRGYGLCQQPKPPRTLSVPATQARAGHSELSG